MPIALQAPLKTLLQDKAYGHVVTVNAEGQPRVTMVWMDVDGNEVLFNTAEGRKKIQDLRRDPRVIVSVQDPGNPQAYAVFHGEARTITEEGARAHIDKLSKRFLGVDKYRLTIVVRALADVGKPFIYSLGLCLALGVELLFRTQTLECSERGNTGCLECGERYSRVGLTALDGADYLVLGAVKVTFG